MGITPEAWRPDPSFLMTTTAYTTHIATARDGSYFPVMRCAFDFEFFFRRHYFSVPLKLDALYEEWAYREDLASPSKT